jgi:hypothetical protein
MKEEIPFVAFGNDEIEKMPEAKNYIIHKLCGKKHKIKYGTTDGKENRMLGFINCGRKAYLATINGKEI